MQPIGDYLKKLLYHYDCIVVPALGAFLTHPVSASFNEQTGQFLPPRRKVAFNGALVLDDGILLNYVMLHERVSREEAQRHLTGFVAELKQQVTQAGSFAIDGLGLFSHNHEEKLQFDPELRHNFMGGTYGLQPVMLPGRVVHLAQPVVRPLAPAAPVRSMPVSTALTVTQPTEAGAPMLADEPILPMPVRVRRQAGPGWRWAAAALLVGSLGFVSYLSLSNPGAPLQSSLNPATLLRGWSTADASTIVPARPVVAEPVATAVAQPAATVAVAANEPAVAAKPTAPNPVAVTSAKPVPSVPAKAVKPQVRSPFTVVAGSFANRGNAIRFQKTLLKAGYADAYIIPGRTKGLIKVVALGTESLDEAVANLDPLKSLTGMNPWVMRKR